MLTDQSDFEALVESVEPDLRRGLAGHVREDAVEDAVAGALAYAWENRDRVLGMENPAGYLYRVAQSKSRRHREGFLVWSGEREMPDIEPGLPDALAALSHTPGIFGMARSRLRLDLRDGCGGARCVRQRRWHPPVTWARPASARVGGDRPWLRSKTRFASSPSVASPEPRRSRQSKFEPR